jgi:hypothetical protein
MPAVIPANFGPLPGTSWVQYLRQEQKLPINQGFKITKISDLTSKTV